MNEDLNDSPDYRELAADIVSAYVSRNTVSPTELASLLTATHDQLQRLSKPQPPVPAVRPEPAVPINRSIGTDRIICLDCGKAFRSLKKHVRSEHGLSLLEYSKRWGLPGTYLFSAPSYTAARSALAKKIGLGVKKTR